MLFVAEYDFGWDMFDAAIAKRLEWDSAAPEDFRFIGEFIWPHGEPAFRGVAVFECDSIDAVNQFVLHYGPTLRMRVHPASDVLSAIRSATGKALPAGRRRARASQAAAGKRRA